MEFDTVEGWEPLCAFLGVAVPDVAFPKANDCAQFRLLFGLNEELTADGDLDEAQARFRAAAGRAGA